MELGLLSERDVATALAQQFQLTLLPESRVARLSIPSEVLDLLPSWLVRERLLVPTFIDPDTRVLSLLTADPTDVPALIPAVIIVIPACKSNRIEWRPPAG